MLFARINLRACWAGMLLAWWIGSGHSLFAAGVTLITHGNSGNTDGWVTGMANALSQRAGGNLPIYRVDVTNGTGGYGAYLYSSSGGNPLVSASGEVIVIVDWRTLANASHTTFGVANAIAPVLAQTNFIGALGGHALAEFPLHIMGHSRGGSLVCELSQRLGERGIWVDHVTTLDAFPVGADAPVAGFENVLFAESYYQTDYILFDGLFIPNAHRRRQTAAGGGYTFFSDWHSDVHLWYHGTIDLQLETSDEEADITTAMRDTWWTAVEQKGSNAGFVYSRLGGGDRYSTLLPNGSNSSPIRDGINKNFDLGAGVSPNRTALMFNTADWPNVIKLDLLTTNPVSQGTDAELRIYYQWAQLPSEIQSVEVWRDVDQNPLNGNEQRLQAGTASGTTAGQVVNGTISVPIQAANAPTGSHRLFVKLSAAGHSRVLYPSKLLTVVASQAAPSLDIAPQNEGVLVGINGVAGQGIVLQLSPDMRLWESIATNVLEAARWEVFQAAQNTNSFFRARLLP